MAEKMITSEQQARLAAQPEPVVQAPATPLVTTKSGSSIASNKTPPSQTAEQPNADSIAKKIIGGIKLPFMNFNSQNPEKAAANHQPQQSPQHRPDNHTTTSNSDDTKDFVVPQRIDLTSNSKSKRPISSQLFDPASGNTLYRIQIKFRMLRLRFFRM